MNGVEVQGTETETNNERLETDADLSKLNNAQARSGPDPKPPSETETETESVATKDIQQREEQRRDDSDSDSYPQDIRSVIARLKIVVDQVDPTRNYARNLILELARLLDEQKLIEITYPEKSRKS